MGDYHNRIMNLQVGEDMPEENPGRGVYKNGHRDARHAAAEIAAEAEVEIADLREALLDMLESHKTTNMSNGAIQRAEERARTALSMRS
ncbi:hypothetical protein [Thioalkalivibrio sp. ALE19]|uniref:hypothetical protein n=1 Tax=Thioalkalivibrio sp. ALE19 TaxID=1266909 RepID=UPI0004074F5F|nr:hypothetical protein [Thioalkalivibrio sp. ALE19]